MSLAKAVHWENMTDPDLDEVEKCVKEEKKRRSEKLENARKTNGMFY